MLGAIIGDIVGSRFEWHNHRSKRFKLFTADCFFTDDTVMTLAVAQAILEAAGDYKNLSQLTIKHMQKIGRRYPDCGYGGMFATWMFSDQPQPYNSFGNGAAMRVSACGFAATSLQEAQPGAESHRSDPQPPRRHQGRLSDRSSRLLARTGHDQTLSAPILTKLLSADQDY